MSGAVAMVPTDLTVSEIKKHHDLAHQHKDAASEHARRAGSLLLHVKSTLSHGQWLPWLKSNFTFTARTAQAYMAAAAPRPKCEAVSHSRPHGKPKTSKRAKATVALINDLQERDRVFDHVRLVLATLPAVQRIDGDQLAALRQLRAVIDHMIIEAERKGIA